MILIIGQIEDPHVASVANSLRAGGRDFVVLDTFSTQTNGFNFCPSDGVLVDVDGSRFALEDVGVVWWRQKPRFVIPTESISELYDYYFVHREWNQILDYIAITLADRIHVNNRAAERHISNKIAQLKLANELGINVPATLISNNFAAIDAFVGGAGRERHIFKTLTPYMTPSGRAAYTTTVDEQLLQGRRDAIRAVPGIYQEFIDKLYELRITIVGNRVFCAEVDWRRSARASVDWREDIFGDIYRIGSIDLEFERSLLLFHERSGLYYGAYDIILNTRGEYYFVEVNPAGQWMWLENLLGFEISRNIAEGLSLADR